MKLCVRTVRIVNDISALKNVTISHWADWIQNTVSRTILYVISHSVVYYDSQKDGHQWQNDASKKPIQWKQWQRTRIMLPWSPNKNVFRNFHLECVSSFMCTKACCLQSTRQRLTFVRKLTRQAWPSNFQQKNEFFQKHTIQCCLFISLCCEHKKMWICK